MSDVSMPNRLFLLCALVLCALVLPVPRISLAWASEADSLMQEIESRHRSGSRLFLMDITMTRDGMNHESRQMLGLMTRSRATNLLIFVVTEPATLRGTTLLIHNQADPALLDTTWLFLPEFGKPRIVQAVSMKTYVAGTDITYDDAKGWISGEQYEFTRAGEEGRGASILARPKSDSLKAYLGYSRLDLRVDQERLAVTGARFYDLAGLGFKTYSADDFVRLGAVWLPRLTTISQEKRKHRTEIRTQYKELRRPPPREIFSPSIEVTSFIDRLESWMKEQDLHFEPSSRKAASRSTESTDRAP